MNLILLHYLFTYPSSRAFPAIARTILIHTQPVCRLPRIIGKTLLVPCSCSTPTAPHPFPHRQRQGPREKVVRQHITPSCPGGASYPPTNPVVANSASAHQRASPYASVRGTADPPAKPLVLCMWSGAARRVISRPVPRPPLSSDIGCRSCNEEYQ
ncbi:hypothetical protein CALCODRAFT_242455 [Calocera cornea HHB12733]|uniref:Uncharacterized protein n=1 Tax=Calocera cornea HHB12733 TaxID=1353952 RepID=A0A165GPP1_9BASI|nr:hypothetical protein CALCODRAFT_242455 [Calocera cornea HHB12733]